MQIDEDAQMQIDEDALAAATRAIESMPSGGVTKTEDAAGNLNIVAKGTSAEEIAKTAIIAYVAALPR